MGENFIKFKNKAFKIRLFKSISPALALGFFVAGILMLLAELELIGERKLLYSGIGVAAALVLGGVLFLLFRLSDIELARRLDSELSLAERVETMLEFSAEESAIHRLQREDANERLASISPKFLKIKCLWIHITALVLGAAMLVTSFVYTKPEPPAPPVIEEEFKITEIQIKAMNELISSVAASEMASPYRENTVSVLSALLETLKATETVRAKNEAVNTAMKTILLETDNSSAAVELMNALWEADRPEIKSLAKAINYYDWPKLDEWDKFTSEVMEFRAAFVNSSYVSQASEDDKINAETELAFLKASTAIVQSLTASQISETDALTLVLTRLALAEEENGDGTRVYGLKKLSALVVSLGYTSVQRELDSTVGILSGDLFAALSAHKVNTDTGENAIKKLGSIFDCVPVRFERPAFIEASGGGGSSSDDEGSGGGGIGSGTEYGSDDLVLDPYTNTYVEYGVIIKRYYKLMFGGLQNGAYTEDEKDAMEKYFAILYGGFDKGEEN